MAKGLIKLAYRFQIDEDTSDRLLRKIWELTYEEFLLKSQAYNLDRKFRSFTEMRGDDIGTNSLHFLIGYAAEGYIRFLKHKLPVIYDTSGNEAIPFQSYKFQILESDTHNRGKHLISITWFTEPLTYYGSIGDFLLISYDEFTKTGENSTSKHLIKVTDEIGIFDFGDDFNGSLRD